MHLSTAFSQTVTGDSANTDVGEDLLPLLYEALKPEEIPCPNEATCRCIEFDAERALAFAGYMYAQWCPIDADNDLSKGHWKVTNWDQDWKKASDGEYLDEKMHGTWTYWRADGSKEVQEEFDRGRRIGTFYRWHENGVIAITGNHVDGEFHGVWIFRDEDGRISRRLHWDKGKVIRSQTTLEKKLSSADSWTRQMALSDLKKLPLEDKSKYLGLAVEALNDEDPNVQMRAAIALGTFGPYAETAVPALTEMFNFANGEGRAQIIDLVARLGPMAIPALVDALKSTDVDIRRGACQALGQIGPQASVAVASLVQLLSEPGYDVSFEAAYSLGSIGAPAVPALLEVIESGSESTRSLVVHKSFLKLPSDVDPSKPLATLLADSSQKPDVRRAAAEALGKLGQRATDAIPALIQALGAADSSVGLAAARGLGDIGQSAVPSVIAVLDSDNPRMRTAATYAIRYMRTPVREAIPKLIELLNDTEVTVRLGAQGALKRIGTEEALEAINRTKK